MLKKYIYFNGKVVPAGKPVILASEIGFLRGYGVFDFMRTFNGKIFYYHDHYKRFVNSAKKLDLKVPVGEQELEKICYQLLKKNNLKDASLRLVLTGGPATDGINFNPQTPTFAILVEDLYELPEKLFQTGAKLMTFNYARLIPEAKNLNYIWAVKLQKEKRRKGATEILYTNNDEILECSTSNFFLVKDGKLITPKTGVLSGITRQITIALVKKLKLKIEERPIKLSELKTADEAFITATNKNILPIIKIDSLVVKNGKVGSITKQLVDKYEELIKNY